MKLNMLCSLLPTLCLALIGLSTVGGTFSKPIVREMARKVQRPIVFPLSISTTSQEAKADDLTRWTDGPLSWRQARLLRL